MVVLGGWGGQFRAEVPVRFGVPQGSVLVSFPLPSVLTFWPPSSTLTFKSPLLCQ